MRTTHGKTIGAVWALGSGAATFLAGAPASAQSISRSISNEEPVASPAEGLGDDSSDQKPTDPRATTDARGDIPIVSYAYSASGATARTIGVQAYGLGLVASGQGATLGGGGSVWGSPIDRLTLIGDAQRNIYGDFSPSAAAVFRILGGSSDGWSLGALGKFKIDGFAAGPDHDEAEGEGEVGALLSFARRGWHVDANGIAGRGTGEDGETDVEARLRLGRDLGPLLRIGLDSETRLRIAGPRYLPNGRTWDFAAGAQGILALGAFFGSVTAGPATMGLTSSNVGWTAVASFGGRAL